MGAAVGAGTVVYPPVIAVRDATFPVPVVATEAMTIAPAAGFAERASEQEKVKTSPAGAVAPNVIVRIVFVPETAAVVIERGAPVEAPVAVHVFPDPSAEKNNAVVDVTTTVLPLSCFVANVEVNANAAGVAPTMSVEGAVMATAEIAGATVVYSPVIAEVMDATLPVPVVATEAMTIAPAAGFGERASEQ